jgi:DNA-directed RNA polymerase specialized sigma24 family protein
MSAPQLGRRIDRKETKELALPPDDPEPVSLSPAEVRSALDALTERDHYWLERVAVALTRHSRTDPQDLLHEAFVRALSGTRRCPRHVSLVKFIAEAMRSIRSDWAKAASRRGAEVSLTNVFADSDSPMLQLVDPRANPEPEIDATQFLKAVLALFDDDIEAQTMIEGTIEGIEGEELRALVSLDKTTFDSKRRLIRRRIDKAFPKEFRP